MAWSGRHVGPAVRATFATLMHAGLLGALITMAPQPLYAWYRGRTHFWGLSALEDQQLAGLIMWVPMGLITAGQAARYIAQRFTNVKALRGGVQAWMQAGLPTKDS